MIAWAIAACTAPCGVEAGPDCTAGFTTDGSPASEDTGVEVGDIAIFAKVEDCTGPEWWYAFDSSVRPFEAELTVTGLLADGTRAEEVHPLDITTTSHWQAEARLLVVEEAESQLPGVSSRFGCDRTPSMSWRLFEWDAEERRSCLLWGAEPAMLEAEGCARW